MDGEILRNRGGASNRADENLLRSHVDEEARKTTTGVLVDVEYCRNEAEGAEGLPRVPAQDEEERSAAKEAWKRLRQEIARS